MTASEALDSLDAVKCFAEIHEDIADERNAKSINKKSGNIKAAKH